MKSTCKFFIIALTVLATSCMISCKKDSEEEKQPTKYLCKTTINLEPTSVMENVSFESLIRYYDVQFVSILDKDTTFTEVNQKIQKIDFPINKVPCDFTSYVQLTPRTNVQGSLPIVIGLDLEEYVCYNRGYGDEVMLNNLYAYCTTIDVNDSQKIEKFAKDIKDDTYLSGKVTEK